MESISTGAETISAGAVYSLPNEDYHADFAIGSSGLKRLAVSPLHYWAEYLDPNRVRKDTAAFAFGRAWHCAVFEPERFETDYVVMPDGLDRRTKEGKALYQELMESGREVLSAADAVTITLMSELAREHPISNVVFNANAEHGQAEVSLFAVDPASGVRVKIRPDWMLVPCAAFPNGLIIDGKTTTDASEAGFARAVWNLEYGLQAAFYTRVFCQVFGTSKRPAFLWLAQEKEAPHAAAYYAAGEDLIAYWDAKIDPLLELYAKCKATDTWPGYSEKVSTLTLPVWAQKQLQENAQ